MMDSFNKIIKSRRCFEIDIIEFIFAILIMSSFIIVIFLSMIGLTAYIESDVSIISKIIALLLYSIGVFIIFIKFWS